MVTQPVGAGRARAEGSEPLSACSAPCAVSYAVPSPPRAEEPPSWPPSAAPWGGDGPGMLRPKTLRGEPSAMRPLDVVRQVMGRQVPLSSRERLVMVSLVMRADNLTAEAEVSLADLEASTGLSRSTVIRTLDRLEHGLRVVTRQKARRADGLNEVNRYQLHPVALERLALGEGGARVSRGEAQGELFGPPRPARPVRAPAEESRTTAAPRPPFGERGGSVPVTPPLVSQGNPGSVPVTPSLLSDLPAALPVRQAPPSRPADPPPVPPAHTGSSPSSGKSPEGGYALPPGTLSAVILEELLAHASLAPLASRDHALALAEAAAYVRKPTPSILAALRQLAAKVAARVARPLRRVAIGFVINAHVDVPACPEAKAIDAPPLSLDRSAALLAQIDRRRQAEEEAEAKRRAHRAALIAQGAIPDPSIWGKCPLPKETTAGLPPALALLSARAEEIDGKAGGITVNANSRSGSRPVCLARQVEKA